MPVLVAVVVTYNRIDKLKKVVEQLLGDPCDALVVVDNGSGDGSREWLERQAEEHERLDLIFTESNLGGAGGFELGFRRAFGEHRADWVVCMDDDARPEPGALERFRCENLDGADGVAAAVYYPDGEICEMNRPTCNPFWSLPLFVKTLFSGGQAFHVSDQDYQGEDGRDIDVTSFVGFFVRREAVERHGYPDGRLFIYGDDVLYTLKLSAAGERLVFLPSVRFVHECSAPERNHELFKPLWKGYYAYRNRMLTYRKAMGVGFWFLLPIFLLKWSLNSRHYGSPRQHMRVMLRAVRDGISKSFDISHEDVVKLVGREP